jgi:hypothetical protein
MSILKRYLLRGELLNSFFSSSTYLTENSLFQLYRPIFMQSVLSVRLNEDNKMTTKISKNSK